MKQLSHGCSYTEIWVSPKNWKTSTSIKKNWYVQCDFYDPTFFADYPTGFHFRRKFNKIKTLEGRRAAIREALKEIPMLFEELGYNPISGIYMLAPLQKDSPIIPDPEPEYDATTFHENLFICDAFRLSQKKIKASDNYIDQVKYAINRFEKAAEQLRMTEIKIGEFRRRQFKEIMEHMELPDNYYNKFRAYFSSLFVELIEYECCDTNITRDIKKRVTTVKQREVLTPEAVELIMEYLKARHYNFYRYAKIFFYSGGRTAELFSVKKNNVRLDKQEYDILLKKGKQYVWETKVIIQNAIPYWKEIMNLTDSEDEYLFSHNLIPGLIKNDSNQITRRWRKLVKDRIVFKNGEICFKADLDKIKDFEYERITADFYSLKHTFLDMLDSIADNTEIDFNLPQEMAGHRSAKITHGVYTTGKIKRKNERLKQLKV